MKATAAISVVDDYKSLGKLNLRELSLVGDEADETSPKQNASAADKQPTTAAETTEAAASAPSSAAELDKTDTQQHQDEKQPSAA